MFRNRWSLAAALLGGLVTVGQAGADVVSVSPISVGSGADTAYVQVEWADQHSEVYAVHFGSTPADTIDGISALQIIDAALPSFSVDVQSFVFGGVTSSFVNGITSGSHTNSGYDAGTFSYWSYWNRDTDADAWTLAAAGASDRLLSDGNWDGWYYSPGSTAPESVSLVSAVPEPASAIAMLAGVPLLAVRRRRA